MDDDGHGAIGTKLLLSPWSLGVDVSFVSLMSFYVRWCFSKI